MHRTLLSHAAILLFTTIAFTTTSGCTPSQDKPAGSVQSAKPPPSTQPPPSPTPSSEAPPPQTSASASAAPPAPGLALVPLLDDAKAKSALEAYRAILKKACGKGVDRRKALAGIGLEIEDESFVCVNLDTATKALASGALVEAGADEVLLQGYSGRSWAGGDATLALMRREGTSYKLVKYLIYGNGWRSLVRVATPSGRDALMLCEDGGHQGWYPGTCGFLEDFTSPREDVLNKNGIGTLEVTACGPQASVTLGKIEFRDERLYAPLFVEHYVLKPANAEETAYCSRKESKSRKMFTIEYRFDGKRFKRVTAIPQEAKAVLERD